MAAEQLYPVAEVAELWRVSPDYIYGLISGGQLRVVNLSKGRAKTRIPESALAEYIERRSRVAGNGNPERAA